MADNITALANTGSGTDVLATDEIAGVHYPRTKLTLGADGVNDGDVSAANPLPVQQSPLKYIDISFSQVGSGVLSPEVALIGTVGTGMTVNQSAGNLVITSGTTANSETVIRSVDAVNGAMTLKEVTQLSQRIANNNFFVELIDAVGDGLAYTIVNATTVDVTLTAHGFTAINVGQRMDICAITGAAGVPMEAVIASIPNANTIRFTVAGWPATGSGTCSLTGYNKIELNYTGTTATAVNFNTRRRGWQNTAIAAAINSTLAIHMGIVNIDNGVASFADKVTGAAGAITTRSSWDTNIPQPDVPLYIQLKARNGTTAPASSTTWTVGMVRVEDYVPTQVSLVATRAQSSQNSLPVAISSGTVTIGNNLTFGTGVNLAADFGLQYRASATGAASLVNVNCPATPAAQAIKASAGRLLGISLANSSTSQRWLKVWNTAAAGVTMGTTAAIIERVIPAGGSLDFTLEGGLGFATAITVAITGGAGLTNNTAVTLGDVTGFIAFA